MLAHRLPLMITLLLILGSSILMIVLGNGISPLVALIAVLVAGLFARGPGNRSAWIGSIGGIAIFLSGTPLTGTPPEGLLVTAVMALYFICLVQSIKSQPIHESAPAGPFTLTFYGTLLLAYLLLKHRLFPFPFVVGIFLATLFIVASLALWELGRRSRLSKVGQQENPTLPDWIGRVCILTALLLGTFLLFRLPLPWLASGALQAAREMNLTAKPPSSSTKEVKNRDWNSNTDPLDPSPQTPSDQNETQGENSDDPWQRGKLPKKADLNLQDVVRLHLEIPDKEQATSVLGKPLYVRAHTLGVYNKDHWERAEYEGAWVDDADDGQADGWVTFETAPPDHVIHQRLYLYNHVAGGSLPSLAHAIAFKGSRVFRQSDDFLSIRQGGDVTYEMMSAPTHYDEVAVDNVLEPGLADAHFLTKAQGLTFRDIDNILLAPIRTPGRPLKEKLRYLRKLFADNYTYGTRIENPDDHDPLANFLFHEKVGYCDFYAQAGAHLLRAIGVPSRVAYGYAGGVYDPKQELYSFRERDAHAWTEMYLKEHGWVIFDLVPSGSGAHRPAETSRISNQVGDPLKRFREAEEMRQQRQLTKNQGTPNFQGDWEDWFKGLWIARYLDLLLALTILGLLVTYLIRRWRRRTEDASHPGASGNRTNRGVPGYFRDFCELFARLGYPRAPGQTLREYTTILRNSNQICDEFEPLLDYHYAVEYEGKMKSKARERHFRQEIKNFGQHRAHLKTKEPGRF